MKRATATILTGLVAGARADLVCPKEVFQTSTVTQACAESTVEVWLTTITVTAPETRTVTVSAGGQSQGLWENWTWTPAGAPTAAPPPSDIPAGCTPAVHTVTSTQLVPKAGSVTTKTGSTLYVGDGQAPKTTVIVTAPSSAGASYGYVAADAANEGPKDNYSYDNPVGSWATTASETIVASGVEIFKWTVEPTGVTKTFLKVPEYTLLPNGNYGFDWNEWAEWAGDVVDDVVDGVTDGVKDGLEQIGGDVVDGLLGNDAEDKDTDSDSTSNSNSSAGPRPISPTAGPKFSNSTTSAVPSATARPVTPPNTHNNNGTSNIVDPTSRNGTAPAPGSAGSNVTAPFEALAKTRCNDASSRSSWCDGKTVRSNTDEDYRTGVTRKFELTLTNDTANLDGTNVMSFLINGQRPGPAIEVNWGDIVQVTVHNQMQRNGTSIHWHGLRQIGTNDQDGVPGVTECPLAPGESRVYTWHASSYGTGWYHSHWMTQSGDGVHGPIIIHGPTTADYDIDAGAIQIEDTFPQTAAQWNEHTSKVGPVGTKNYLLNGHNTKADLSGGQHALWTVQKGKKYLFRLINSASQNMFSVSLDGHDMQVVAADFIPIQPYTTKWLNIGIGQRYDVIVDMDQAVDSYFFRAVTQMGCPSSCDNTGLGQANGIIAYEGVPSDPYFLPTSTTDKQISDFVTLCDDEPLASLVPIVSKAAGDVNKFSSAVQTIPAGNVASIQTADNGVVTRWYLNNGWQNIDFTHPTLQTLADTPNATINNAVVLNKANEWYYFIIQNQFIAGHPMHLHGHDFSILGQGEGVFDSSMVGTLNFANPMRRDTGMLKGVESPQVRKQGWTVIAFETDNPGAWLMHCHIVWHVDGGLSLQWIERPDDIDAGDYVDEDFKDTCKAYSAYEALSPAHKKTSGASGLRRRMFFDESLAVFEAGNVSETVKRSSRSEKRFLADLKAKRDIGHSRHFRK